MFASLLTLALLLPGVLLITAMPAASAGPGYGSVSVEGRLILVDGQAPSARFFGVVDATVLPFAILAYIEGQTQYAGRTSVFMGPDTGSYGPVTPNDSLDSFFDRYFALMSYYHCNLVRLGALDKWSTGILYDAWANHNAAFLSLLRTMEAKAEAHQVWVVPVLAGTAEYPGATFGGSGSAFDPASSAYANYISYCIGVMTAMDGLVGIAWYDLFNEADHDICYTNYWASHGGKTGFNSWACSVAEDTADVCVQPRTMGVAGLGKMFGWGKADFDLSTGTVPFEIASRHYYASNSDAYIFTDPEGWARADNKPLYWGELAYNGVYPLTRYTFGENTIWSAGGQAITSMVLTGTSAYPVGSGTMPTASLTVNPALGNSSTAFAFDASSSSDPQDDSSALQARWDWDGDGAYDTEWTTTKIATHSYSHSGTYTVRVEVRNGIMMTGTATATVTVDADDPVLSISSPLDGDMINGTTATVYWNGSDGGSGVAGYQIALDGGEWTSLDAVTDHHTYQGLAEGSHAVAVRCRDLAGNFVTATTSFVISVMGDIFSPAADFDYRTINAGTEVEITGYHGPGGSVGVPNKIDGLPVTSVGANAFSSNAVVTSVSLPFSVMTIGDQAFYRCSLTSVTLPNSLTAIGSKAFAYSSLVSVTMPSSVSTIGGYAFYSCSSLSSAVVGSGVTSVEDYTFALCSSLTGVTVPPSVTSIGMNAFYSCSSLMSVTLPSSLVNIGNKAFAYTSSLRTISLPSSLTTLGAYVFAYSGVTSITIPSSVTSTGDYTFYRCSSLASVTIESGVTAIGAYAFTYTAVSSITLPSSVASIGSYAFYKCSSLTSVSLANGLQTIGSYAFVSCPLSAVTVPSTVTSVGDYAFYGCASLTTVSLTSGLKTIGMTAFGFSGITSITVPSTVTSIGSHAFYSCTSLTTATIPSSVTSLGGRVFAYCSALTSIDLPGSIGTVQPYAFYRCTSLTSATLGDGITSVDDYAFYKCSSLTTLTMPSTLVTIRPYAFSYTAITSVTIPNSVTTIGSYAFYGCSSLTSAYFQGNAPSVGTGCFGARNAALVVYYHVGATGFTNPWQGVPTATW